MGRIVTSKFRSLTATLSKTAAAITEDIEAARRTISRKRKELERLRHAPLPLQEVEARVSEMVTKAAAQWLKGRGASFVSSENGIAHPAPRRHPELPWPMFEALPFAALCAADSQRAISLVMELVRGLEYETGPPGGERPGLIEKLEAEIEKLEKQEEGFVDDAIAAGADTAHRPEVQERRAAEERKSQIEQARAEERARRRNMVEDR